MPSAPTTLGSTAFLEYLEEWRENLEPLPLPQLIVEAGGPRHVGIFCVDMVKGFCTEGTLASDRVARLTPKIAELFQRAYDSGVRHFVLPHDCHDPAAPEFEDYPVHCMRGTSETETVPELTTLPFAAQFVHIPKNCLSSALRTGLDAWLHSRPEVTHRIVVGDCTDLCVYQLAMHLKLTANACNISAPVVLPASCSDTYDIPLDVARAQGIFAHPGDLFHELFLYHMATNGVRVVSEIS